MEADSLEGLKAHYIDMDSSINEKEIGYIIYNHDSGMETELTRAQVDDFIESVNTVIYDNRSPEQKEWDIACDKYHNGRDE
jgi:hypothetical protein